MSNYVQLRSQLDDAIASECPFCGDLMIREISLPFIHPEEEQHLLLSWEIKPSAGNQNQRNMSLPLSAWVVITLLFTRGLLIVPVPCSVFGCECLNPYSFLVYIPFPFSYAVGSLILPKEVYPTPLYKV